MAKSAPRARTDMSKPNISVVIPTKDRAVLLFDCLKSCESQTVKPDEIIVIDEGEIESAHPVLEQFSQTLNIKHVEGDRKGVARARNRALEYCNSEYICIQDDDDLMLPWRVEQHLHHLNINGTDISYGGWINFDSSNQHATAYKGLSFSLDALLHVGRVLIHGGTAIRKDLLAAIGYDETFQAGVDFNMFARAAIAGARFGHCGHYNLLRRIHDNRLGTTRRDVQVETRRLSVDQFAPDPPSKASIRQLSPPYPTQFPVELIDHIGHALKGPISFIHLLIDNAPTTFLKLHDALSRCGLAFGAGASEGNSRIWIGAAFGAQDFSRVSALLSEDEPLFEQVRFAGSGGVERYVVLTRRHFGDSVRVGIVCKSLNDLMGALAAISERSQEFQIHPYIPDRRIRRDLPSSGPAAECFNSLVEGSRNGAERVIFYR